MFVEMHLLQNFVPSNLNRDDSGAPKDCEFGGYRRARVSSQCIKRGIRDLFRDDKLLPEQDRADRTKLLREWLGDEIANARGKTTEADKKEARDVADTAVSVIGLKPDARDKNKTQYLTFLGRREVLGLAEVCKANWDELKAGKVSNDVKKKLLAALDGGKAADLALFGRMLADLPDKNCDGACQVAHAISTNRVLMDFDFYTAIDDRKPEDTAGAEMLGTIEFNSSCFYRYANVDFRQLKKNLDGDKKRTLEALRAFIRASIDVIPSGKITSMAQQCPPSFILLVVRDRKLWSLANAFVRPVQLGAEGDLIGESIQALAGHWGKLVKMYGDSDIMGAWYCALDDYGLDTLKESKVGSVDELIKVVMTRVEASDQTGETLS